MSNQTFMATLKNKTGKATKKLEHQEQSDLYNHSKKSNYQGFWN